MVVPMMQGRKNQESAYLSYTLPSSRRVAASIRVISVADARAQLLLVR